MAEYNDASRLIDRRRLPAGYDDKAEKLEYLRQMLVELRKLSLNVDCVMLAYLLEMAATEAVQCSALHAQAAIQNDTQPERLTA
jgi:hypothetical protein